MTIFADRFGGRTAVVTGGVSGFGLDVARRVIAEGGQAIRWDHDADALRRARAGGDRRADFMRSKIPMGRLGKTEETTAMIYFLASEECSYSTAATFDTSGGRTTF